jgi:hypothetical protein
MTSGIRASYFKIQDSTIAKVYYSSKYTEMENMSNEGALVSKVPMLKPNEFGMWKIRIKQYILLTDYSMWDIIENGPAAQEETSKDG